MVVHVVKVIHVLKNKRKKKRYLVYLFLGPSIPPAVRKLLALVQDLPVADALKTLTKEQEKQLRATFGLGWCEKLWIRKHLQKHRSAATKNGKKFGTAFVNWWSKHYTARSASGGAGPPAATTSAQQQADNEPKAVIASTEQKEAPLSDIERAFLKRSSKKDVDKIEKRVRQYRGDANAKPARKTRSTTRGPDVANADDEEWWHDNSEQGRGDVCTKRYVYDFHIAEDEPVAMLRRKIAVTVSLPRNLFSDQKAPPLLPRFQYLWFKNARTRNNESLLHLWTRAGKNGAAWKYTPREIPLTPLESTDNAHELREVCDGVRTKMNLNYRSMGDMILCDVSENIDELYLADAVSQLLSVADELQARAEADQVDVHDAYMRRFFPRVFQDEWLRWVALDADKRPSTSIARLKDKQRALNNLVGLRARSEAWVASLKLPEKMRDLAPVVTHLHCKWTRDVPWDDYWMRRVVDAFPLSEDIPKIEYVPLVGESVSKLHQSLEGQVLMEYKDKFYRKGGAKGLSIAVRLPKFKNSVLNVRVRNQRLEARVSFDDAQAVSVAKILPVVVEKVTRVVVLFRRAPMVAHLKTPQRDEFVVSYVNGSLRVPGAAEPNHYKLSELARVWFPYFAVDVDPTSRGRVDGTYLRYVRVSNYHNEDSREKRILMYLRNAVLEGDEELSERVQRDFNITADQALREIAQTRAKFGTVAKSNNPRSLEHVARFRRQEGASVEIMGKDKGKVFVRIMGARGENQLARICAAVTRLLHQYTRTHGQKKDAHLRNWLKTDLKHVAHRKDLVMDKDGDVTVRSSGVASNAAFRAKTRRDPERMKAPYSRLVSKNKQPDSLTQKEIDDPESGWARGKDPGTYVHKKRKLVAYPLPREDTGELVYYYCDPKHVDKGYTHMGFSHSKKVGSHCYPSCNRMDRGQSDTATIRAHHDKCLAPGKAKIDSVLRALDETELRRPRARDVGLILNQGWHTPGRLSTLPPELDLLANGGCDVRFELAKNKRLILAAPGAYVSLGTPVVDAPQDSFLHALSYVFDKPVATLRKELAGAKKFAVPPHTCHPFHALWAKVSLHYGVQVWIIRLRRNCHVDLATVPYFMHALWHARPLGQKKAAAHAVVLLEITMNQRSAHYVPLVRIKSKSGGSEAAVVPEIRGLIPLRGATKDPTDVLAARVHEWALASGYLKDLNQDRATVEKTLRTGARRFLAPAYLHGWTLVGFLKQWGMSVEAQVVSTDAYIVFLVARFPNNGKPSLIPTVHGPPVPGLKTVAWKAINALVQSPDASLQPFAALPKLWGDWTRCQDSRGAVVALESSFGCWIPVVRGQPKAAASSNATATNSAAIDLPEIEKLLARVEAEPEGDVDANQRSFRSFMFLEENEELFFLHLSDAITGSKGVRQRLEEVVHDEDLDAPSKREKVVAELWNLHGFWDLVAGVPAQVGTYLPENQRQVCPVHKTKDGCGSNLHCTWADGSCKLAVPKERIAPYVNRAAVWLVDNPFFRKRMLKLDHFRWPGVRDSLYIQPKKNQIVFRNTNVHYANEKVRALVDKLNTQLEKQNLKEFQKRCPATPYERSTYRGLSLRPFGASDRPWMNLESEPDPLFRAIAYAVYSVENIGLPLHVRSTNIPKKTIDDWTLKVKRAVLKLSGKGFRNLVAYQTVSRVAWMSEAHQLELAARWLGASFVLYYLTKKKIKKLGRIGDTKETTLELVFSSPKLKDGVVLGPVFDA